MRAVLVPTFVLALTGAACTTSVPEPEDELAYLSPTDHLVRASMALRGIRPSVAELEQVAADPDSLPAIVDTYLASPELGVVMRDLHAETLLVRVDTQRYALPAAGPLAGKTVAEINASVFDEPLRLIEYVIVNDRPYTEIVTADYMLADGIVAGVWGVPYAGDGASWEVTAWDASRPAAGILSSSALFFRHRSDAANFQRGRANMISSALLCHDYLDADITVDTTIDLSDPDVVADAVQANPACAGCHQTLDPLGSFLTGWVNNVGLGGIDSYPVQSYDPTRENRWQYTTRRAPGFFGQPGEQLDDLGRMIAEDPRFARCTAERFASYFTQIEAAQLEFDWIAGLTDDFVGSAYDAKALARAIVLSDRFRLSHAADPALADDVVGLLHIRPEQLQLMFADLTGFSWSTDSSNRVGNTRIGVTDLLRSDMIGFRSLAGGIDSYYVTLPTHTITTVSSLLLRMLAAQAAGLVVDTDLAAPLADRRLLTEVEADDDDPAVIRVQLATLHARIYGALDSPDSDQVEETYQLFLTVLDATGDIPHAWKATLTAMLSDLRVAYY